MPNKYGWMSDGCAQLLLADSPESWSLSVSPEWKLLELQEAEWLMVGLIRTCLSAPEELEARLSSRGTNMLLA